MPDIDVKDMPELNAKDVKKFEADMLSNLKSLKFDAGLAKNYSATVTKLKLLGWHPDRIFPKGRPGFIDGVTIMGQVTYAQLAKFPEIAKELQFNGIEIFPVGVPKPEKLGYKAEFGAAQINSK